MTTTFSDLPMRPGRRRMLDSLVSAGSDGVSMADLMAVFYADQVPPPSGSRSSRGEVDRLRSQIASFGFVIVSVRQSGHPAGLYVLKPAQEITPAAPQAPPPAPAGSGLRSVPRSICGALVSLPRLTLLDGAAP